MLKKKALHWAVAAAIGGLASAGASAAITVVGSEMPPSSLLPAGTFLSATTLYAPTTANPLYLTYTLSGGASFNGVPSLGCNAVSGGGAGAISNGSIQLAAGGAGTAVATFVVTAVSAASQISSCTITNGTALVGTWPASVGENVVLTYGNGLAPTGSNSTALLAASSIFTNGAQGSDTNTALVASGFVSFSTLGPAASAYLARLGRFTITLNGNLQDTGAAANTLDVSAFTTALSITVNAPSLNGSINASGQVYVTFNTAAVGSAGCADPVVVSGFGGSSTVSFSAIAAPATAAGYYAICQKVTGGTAIPAGDVTVGVTGTANTDPNNANGSAYQISTLIAAGTKIGTVTRNGSSTTVLNLPRAADTDLGFLRVYNTSNNAGPVTMTVYSQGTSASSALVTNCSISSSLGANQALVMNMTQIESAITGCGGTIPTAGRYRIDLNGSFPTMRAQAFARSNGTLTNISGDSSGDGN